MNNELTFNEVLKGLLELQKGYITKEDYTGVVLTNEVMNHLVSIARTKECTANASIPPPKLYAGNVVCEHSDLVRTTNAVNK